MIDKLPPSYAAFIQLTFQIICWFVTLLLSHSYDSIQHNYCEPYYSPYVSTYRQPFNTWSNIGFYVVSWVMSLLILRRKSMTWYSLLTPMCITFVGMVSIVYHGNPLVWTGSMDVIGIFIYVMFEMSYSIRELTKPLWFSPGLLLVVWVAGSVLLGCSIYLNAGTFANGDISFAVNLSVGLALGIIALIELVTFIIGYGYCQKLFPRIGKYEHHLLHIPKWPRYAWLIACIVFGVTGVVLWSVANDSSPTCLGVDYVGHGLWHIFMSLTMYCMFMYRSCDHIQDDGYVNVANFDNDEV